MIVKSLELHNYRGVSDLLLGFHPSLNILVGINGAGKTAILDCLAVMLSRLIGRIRTSTGTGRFFTNSDVKNGQSVTRNKIVVTFDEDDIGWSVSRVRSGSRNQQIVNLGGLRELVERVHKNLDADKDYNLPLAVYYPVNRSVLDIPLRIRKRHEFDQLAAYDQALSGKQDSFRVFFEWFRNREDIENEKRVTKSSRYRDVELEAVRRAIESILDGFSGLRVSRSPLRMVVNKGSNELVVNQLSDGEKCTLALAGDLARRMAIANPARKNPLEGPGVVLIDEVDLHLHPTWQARVVPKLRDTFPGCQFILTTHSPLILNSAKPENIWALSSSGTSIGAVRPSESFGRDVNRILEDVMQTQIRPADILKRLSKLFREIDGRKLKSARRQLKSLTEDIGEGDPDLQRARTLIDRYEVLGS